MSKTRTTILDIGREVHVTHGTVSRALRGDKRVSEETRQKVLQAAQRLGYHPNIQARLFQQGITGNAGVFLGLDSWTFYAEYFGRMISGLADAADEDGKHLLFFLPEREKPGAMPGGTHLKLKGLEQVTSGKTDAIFILAHSIDAESMALLASLHQPVVLLNTPEPTGKFSQLLANQDQAAALAVGHLVSLGHRKLGYLGFSGDIPFNRDMQQAHAWEPGCFVTFAYGADPVDPRAVEEAVRRLIGLGISALVCCYPEQALMTATIARKMGLSLPRDLSLISFACNPASAFTYYQPALTLVLNDPLSAGKDAYALIHEPAGAVIRVPWKVLPGESVADLR